MKRTFPLLFLVLLVSLNAIGTEFIEKIESGIGNKIAVIMEYLEKTDDIDDLRLIQDEWLSIDAQACNDYFAGMMRENPADIKYRYLWARSLEDEQSQLSEARKIVSENPHFLYGYYLLSYPYTNGLFMTTGRIGIPAEELKFQFRSDRALLLDWLKYFPNDEEGLYTLYAMSIWEKNYQEAEKYLMMTAENRAYWVNYDVIIEFSKESGRLAAFQTLFPILLQGGVDAGYITPEDKIFLYQDYYTYLLKELNKWDELEQFLEENPKIKGQTNMLKHLISLHIRKNDFPAAISYLNELYQKGGWTYKTLINNEEWSVLKHQKGWSELETTAYNQWKETEGQRRTAVLAERTALLSPRWEMKDVKGNLISVAQLTGKTKILVFWSPYNEESLKALTVLNRWQKENTLSIFAVTSSSLETESKRIFSERNWEIEQLFGDEQIYRKFNISRLPYFTAIDGDGIIRFSHTGYREDIDDVIGFWAEDIKP